MYITGTLLVAIYIAIVSPYRSEMPDADAWEHHRAIKALLDENFWPGNPTYATDEPSVRYSPYSVALAGLCRLTGADAYGMLTAAGVVSWILLSVGIWWLLRIYGDESAAPTVLGFLVLFYGVAPGYANSFALSDLPWHQVNPSAFSIALNFIAWSLFAASRHERVTVRSIAWLLAAIAIALSVLSHGMSGVLGGIGIAVLPWSLEPQQRRTLLVGVVAIGVVSFLLCAIWPWYNFIEAVLWGQDKSYWFNAVILRRMLFIWCLPSYLLLLVVLPLRERPLVRWCLIMAAIAMGLSGMSWLIQSATLARLPLAALPLLHMALGIWAHDFQLFKITRIPERLRQLLCKQPDTNSVSVLTMLIWAMFLYAALPQVYDILSQPYLARPLIASLAGRENKQPQIAARYAEVLRDVDTHDVILATPETAWPAPSFAGRIVAAAHYELFSPRQRERHDDVQTFFTTTDFGTQLAIIQKYRVDYLLIDTTKDEKHLVHTDAIVSSTRDLVLMDAQAWLAASAPGEPSNNDWSHAAAGNSPSRPRSEVE
jgi:hypothetical protein